MQCLVDIGDQVADVLEPDGQPHRAGPMPDWRTCSGVKSRLPMSCGAMTSDSVLPRLAVSANNSRALAEVARRLAAIPQIEGDHRAGVAHLLLASAACGWSGSPGVVHLADGRMPGQVYSDPRAGRHLAKAGARGRHSGELRPAQRRRGGAPLSARLSSCLRLPRASGSTESAGDGPGSSCGHPRISPPSSST